MNDSNIKYYEANEWDRMELLEANNIITRVRILIYSSNKRLNLTKESLVD